MVPGSGDGSRDSLGSPQRGFYDGWVTVLNLWVLAVGIFRAPAWGSIAVTEVREIFFQDLSKRMRTCSGREWGQCWG